MSRLPLLLMSASIAASPSSSPRACNVRTSGSSTSPSSSRRSPSPSIPAFVCTVDLCRRICPFSRRLHRPRRRWPRRRRPGPTAGDSSTGSRFRRPRRWLLYHPRCSRSRSCSSPRRAAGATRTCWPRSSVPSSRRSFSLTWRWPGPLRWQHRSTPNRCTGASSGSAPRSSLCCSPRRDSGAACGWTSEGYSIIQSCIQK